MVTIKYRARGLVTYLVLGLSPLIAMALVNVSANVVVGADIQGRGELKPPPPWGGAVYQANCAVCHGTYGDGNGPAARMFVVRPREFRSGVFKFRSTPSGSLPTDEDLWRTVTQGIRWTGMLARPDLSHADLEAVIAYVKSFSPRFTAEKPLPPVAVPPPPVQTSELVARGKELYQEADCASCHGNTGRGDGPSGAGMKDDWGRPLRPSDLTWRPLKRGSSLHPLYLTLATGLSGTPMPSYGGALDGEQIWSLVYYLESLVPPERRLSPRQSLGEEQQGRMALHMGGMMGSGMMRRFR